MPNQGTERSGFFLDDNVVDDIRTLVTRIVTSGDAHAEALPSQK